jgi:hypothetical protein
MAQVRQLQLAAGEARMRKGAFALVALALALVAVALVALLGTSELLGTGAGGAGGGTASVEDGTQPDFVEAVGVYFAGMGECDRAARRDPRADSAAAYLACVVPPAALPPSAARRLSAGVARAHALMLRAGCVTGLASPRPWRVVVLRDEAEGGMPHTHGAVVCMPLSSLEAPAAAAAGRDAFASLVTTLVHERVHVFQRAEPDAVAAVVRRQWGMTAHPRAQVCAAHGVADLARSNPDLDGLLYAPASSPGVVSLSLFPSVEAAALGGLRSSRVVRLDVPPQDATPKPSVSPEAQERLDAALAEHEHPYEAMAYWVADAVSKGTWPAAGPWVLARICGLRGRHSVPSTEKSFADIRLRRHT